MRGARVECFLFPSMRCPRCDLGENAFSLHRKHYLHNSKLSRCVTQCFSTSPTSAKFMTCKPGHFEVQRRAPAPRQKIG